MANGWRSSAARGALVAIGYVAAGLLGVRLAHEYAPVTSVWPASGVALAGLLLVGVRLWPAVWLGAFASTLLTGGSPGAALAVSSGATLEAAGAAWLLGLPRVALRSDLGRVRDVLAFVVVGPLCVVPAAAIGTATVALRGGLTGSTLGHTWLTWWIGDALGILLVAPLLLCWTTRPYVSRRPWNSAEGAVAAAAAVGVAWLSFSGVVPVSFLVAPVVIWAALRFGQRGASTVTAAISAIAIANTVHARGPFGVFPVESALLLLQVFTLVVAMTALFLGAIATEREVTQRALREARDGLERRVNERTSLLSEANRHLAVELTERHRAELLAKLNEERLRLALQGADLGLWDWRVGTGEVTFNERWAEMLGYRLSDLEGRISDWQRLVHPDDMPMVQAALQAHFEGRTPLYESEHRCRTRSGEWKWVLDRGGVFERDAEGRPVRMAGTHLDITERKRAEEERRRLEAHVLQAQKLESLGLLAGGIAHDFNNLLTVILGQADLALSSPTTDAGARVNLSEIKQASRRAADLASQMLAYSGRIQFVIEPVDLSELVGEMKHLLQASVSKKARLVWQLGAGLPMVNTDPTQLQQVLMNLVINASEAIGERDGLIRVSTFTVGAEGLAFGDEWAYKPAASPAYVALEVTDTGAGMDADTLVRIFDPFYSTKFSGRGLGLATVLGIVRGHQGGLKVESTVGAGTTFTILFAAAGRPAAAGASNTRDPSAPWSGTGTVLVVDDEAAVRTLASAMVQRCGFGTMTAVDGEDALAVFHEHGGRFACVLLDMTMPRRGGEDTLKEIRRSSPDVPVILSSGYPEPDVIGRAGGAHTSFIQKPYTLAALRGALQAATGGVTSS